MGKISGLIEKKWFFLFFLAIAFSMWAAILFGSPNSKYADESTHYRQISWFLKGNYGLRSDLTTIPGYHMVMAMMAKPFGHTSPDKIRLVSFIVSVISLAVFFAISKKIGVANPFIRTLQFVFLPISFLYFPLIYTDIFSLLLVLAVFYFALNKQYEISAFFSLAAILARQNNIIWVLFVWLYDYVSVYGFAVSGKTVAEYGRRTLGYAAVCLAFAVFVWLNKGIAIGDKENQQVGFYLGNIYFFLAVAGTLFLPVLMNIIYNCKFNLVNLKRFLVFGLGTGILISCSFVFFPPEIHIYNLKLAFLRNIILQLAYHRYVWIYASAIFLGYVTLFLMKFKENTFLLFPFIILFLLPSLLVEQRYLIIPLAFLLLFRKEVGNRTEYLLTAYFMVFSVALTAMLFHTNIFF